MVATETLIIASLLALNLISTVLLGLWMRNHLDEALEELDERLALAVKGLADRLVEGGLQEFEPPNPIQTAIAQFLQAAVQQKMNTVEAVVTERSPSGQFVSSSNVD
jgi:hypothetical protein